MYAYRLLIILLSPLILGYIVWKGFQCRQLRFILQRFGLGIGHLPKNCLWFHCASVGETNTALPLIRELHQRRPGLCFLITTNTATGAKIVGNIKDIDVHHAYLPIDWMIFVNNLIKQARPVAICLVDTELWPNLISACNFAAIPTCIINGRLTSRTTQAGSWMRQVHAQTLQSIDRIYARSEPDREQFIQLGATENTVKTLGNIKFSPPDISSIQSQQITEREYVIAASTHDDEELKIAQCWKALARNELLVIAIRHPERGARVFQQLGSVADHIAVRSRGDVVTEQTKIFLLDTVGELNSWFEKTKLVIMGGSFVPVGGHNILEPAHFGKAIVFGPHMETFQEESALLLSKDAAIQVKSIEDLMIMLTELLDNRVTRAQLEQNVQQAVAPFASFVSDYADELINQFRI